MEQKNFSLVSARTEWSEALLVLYLIKNRAVSITIEDLMYAYMLAKDWCLWIENPESSDESPLKGKKAKYKSMLYIFEKVWIENPEPSNESPLKGKKADYEPMLNMFESYVKKLAGLLWEEEDRVKLYFETFNPNLTNLCSGENLIQNEDIRLLYRSLHYTAEMFEEELKDYDLIEILNEKDVPFMNELTSSECLRREGKQQRGIPGAVPSFAN